MATTTMCQQNMYGPDPKRCRKREGPETGKEVGLTLALLHVEDAVLLEDGAKHGLDDNAGSGVSNERALLVELLGEQVNAEVAVLAGGGRGRDADDLAGAVLEHHEVADPDVVAGDRDRVGHDGDAGVGAVGAGRLGALNGEALPAAHMAARVWEYLVSDPVKTLAEGMIMTWPVLASHVS